MTTPGRGVAADAADNALGTPAAPRATGRGERLDLADEARAGLTRVVVVHAQPAAGTGDKAGGDGLDRVAAAAAQLGIAVLVVRPFRHTSAVEKSEIKARQTINLELPEPCADDASVTSSIIEAVVRVIGLDGQQTLVLTRRPGPPQTANSRSATDSAGQPETVTATDPTGATTTTGTPATARLTGATQPSKAPEDASRWADALVAHAVGVACRRTDARLLHLPGDEATVPNSDDSSRRLVTIMLDDGSEVVLVEEPAPDETALDALHASNADPWRTDSWYERRKAALLLAALPRERYHRVLELGCSRGALARQLADRADAVVAMDASPAALDAARQGGDAGGRITWQLGRLPHDWPDGAFDLVVASEVGYFLSPGELDRVADRLRTLPAPAPDVALCHWRPPPQDWPLDGDQVHRRFRAALTRNGEFARGARYREELFRLDVLVADPSSWPVPQT